MSAENECFFIAPIGDEGSEIRERSDTLMEYIVKEAVSDYDYSVSRADQLDQPGSITSQIIQKTVESDLVIADLTGHNPNVFYELAVRHATSEPYIQLIESTDSIPFDISDLRTIKYGLDVEMAEKARKQIRSQLELLNDDNSEFDNPISQSAEMQSLRESTKPEDQNLAKVLKTVSSLDRKVSRLENNMAISHETNYDLKEDTKRISIDGQSYVFPDGIIAKGAIKSISNQTNRPPEDVEDILKKNQIQIE